MAAALCGHVEVVKLLLDYGADPTVKNKRGKTALDLASACNGDAFEGKVAQLHRLRVYLLYVSLPTVTHSVGLGWICWKYQRFVLYFLRIKAALGQHGYQQGYLVCHERSVRSDRQESHALPAHSAKARGNLLHSIAAVPVRLLSMM